MLITNIAISVNTSVFIFIIIAVINNDSMTQRIPFINQRKVRLLLLSI